MSFGSFSLWVGAGLLVTQLVHAHGPKPLPLQRVPIPPVPGLTDGPDPVVIDKNAAIALGKALFWDVNVGSDGMACGSCHFHAGADSRVTNQLNPGLKSTNPTGQTFEATKTAATGGSNYTMRVGDFPFHQYSSPVNGNSTLVFDSDDVMASAGTFSGGFTGASKLTGSNDVCSRAADPVFHVGATGTRRVEPRNAPTVINSVFNYRNFWDGRANNVFNGSSPWGDRDSNAGVWVKLDNKTVQKQRLHLINSSLASLSVAPPLSDTEMSCQNRAWPDIGRKLLSRQPLQNQKVHYEDSVLGVYSSSTPGNLKSGLNATYKSLVIKAFSPKYRSFVGTAGGQFGVPSTGTPYDQFEANFSMFFGIALQLYQSTLISDQAPIDLTNRSASREPLWDNLGYDQEKINRMKSGFSAFFGQHCNICHSGPTMTNAAIVTNAMIVTPTTDPVTQQPQTFGPPNFSIPFGDDWLVTDFSNSRAGITRHGNVISRNLTGNAYNKIMDMGFANTGVSTPNSDPGLNGVDDFGNPLSFSKQYLSYLLNDQSGIKDAVVHNQWACDFIVPLTNLNFDTPDSFGVADQASLIVDGSREGVNRTDGCRVDGETFEVSPAYIPSPELAASALNTPKLGVATQAAFKIPTLRNIGLTGPYMHNGGMSTLKQVVEFYARGGNFFNDDTHNVVLDAGGLAVSATARNNLIEFLTTGLTDERVAYERAPFDHPEIAIPNGHLGNHQAVVAGNPIAGVLAKDQFLTIPAVGANGNTTPLLPFDAGLAP